MLLDQLSTTIELEFEPDWVYPDTDAKGYYRFALADELLAQSLPHFNAQTLNVRERLAFTIFEKMGEPAPRESFCRLYINNEYQGLYAITEEIDVGNPHA